MTKTKISNKKSTTAVADKNKQQKGTLSSKERDTIYVQALSKWGAQAQIGIAIEDIGELVQVLREWESTGFEGVPQKLIEEIADAEIMLEQLNFICQARSDAKIRLQVDKIKSDKLTKLKSILAGGK